MAVSIKRNQKLFTTLFLVCLSLLSSSHSQSTVYNDSVTLCANSSNASIEYAQCLDDIPEWESCPDPSLCETTDGNNVGLAFGLTIGAGLATTIGALLPFIPFIKRSNTTFLAIGLALAAGVMIYVSFTEILKKSKDNFCCSTPEHYEVAATGCFFGGIILTILLDLLVGLLQKIDCGCGCGSMSQCASRCCRGKRQILNSEEVNGSSKADGNMNDRAFHHQAKSGKHWMSSVNGFHKEFDFVRYHSKEGHTPMVSSSEVSTISTRSAESLEEGEEPVIMAVGRNTSSETESNMDPLPTCNSQRALLNNIVVNSSNIAAADLDLIARQNSVSDTESRQQVAVTPDGVSTTLSENTNNYTNASVNELFSNSSLLRMNAVIQPETESLSGVREEVEAEGEGVSVTVTDSKSHVSVMVDGCGDGDMALENGTKTAPLRRHSYSEMVEMKHDDLTEPMGPKEFKEVAMVMGKDARKLHRMGILTGLAVGIHNFPEGLATFVAALSSPSLGIALAIAIALHNIPEGVCVAMPVYYATGKKWKGFLWAFISGISEPFGALLGWLVFKDLFGPLVYGCLFGFIAGMMVFISLKELLPTAHKFDKRGILVAIFIVIGMVVMAASLLLFLY